MKTITDRGMMASAPGAAEWLRASFDPVPVAGIQPLTTVDFPDLLSAVVFLQGCNWHCAYCHNPHLRPIRNAAPAIAWDDVRAFLQARRGLLDAIVFSGGEPTLHAGLPAALREVRAQGYKIGLHTNGAFPRRIQALLDEGLVDWFGLDVKAPRWLYEPVTGQMGADAAVWETLRLLLKAGVSFDARTTVYRPALDDEEVLRMATELRKTGLRALKLQPWRPLSAPGEFIPIEDLSALQAKVNQILAPASKAPNAKRAADSDRSAFAPALAVTAPAAVA